MSYLLLIGGVVCVIFAKLFLEFFIISFDDSSWAHTASENRYRRRMRVAVSVGFFIAAYLARMAYQHLLLADPGVLEGFGWWYFGGLVSRFLVLAKRHEILSPHFSVDWDEVHSAFYWALGGSLVTMHLVHVLIWEKN